MIVVKRFHDSSLSQVSYLIGSTEARQAVVVDPLRDIDQYIRAAAEEGVAITHVTETHIHADFVSGSRDLAQRTGARLYLSDEGGEGWRYGFAREAGAVLLKDGDTIDAGSVRLQALHTPGHTPEHLTFLLTDRSISGEPLAALTGDFLFVGDVGRPDLLERSAHVAGSMTSSARQLFQSLSRLRAYPDHLQVWPGHTAGSACGKGIGSLPYSTLGYERRTNWALKEVDEAAFVRTVLAGLPDPPPYFGEMKRVNRDGPPPLPHPARMERLSVERLAALVDAGAVIVDTRPAAEFAEGHIRGALNIPLNRSFTTWAGWLVPQQTDYYLVVDDRCTHCLDDARGNLAMIGLDRVRGVADAGVLDAWRSRGRELARIAQMDAAGAARALADGTADVIDVRSRAEWDAGHIPGARHIPLGDLSSQLDALDRNRTWIVHCQGGARSAIAAGLLSAHGLGVVNLAGGFSQWQAEGRAVDRAAQAVGAGAH